MFEVDIVDDNDEYCKIDCFAQLIIARARVWHYSLILSINQWGVVLGIYANMTVFEAVYVCYSPPSLCQIGLLSPPPSTDPTLLPKYRSIYSSHRNTDLCNRQYQMELLYAIVRLSSLPAITSNSPPPSPAERIFMEESVPLRAQFLLLLTIPISSID